jgi:hypothetical protein
LDNRINHALIFAGNKAGRQGFIDHENAEAKPGQYQKRDNAPGDRDIQQFDVAAGDLFENRVKAIDEKVYWVSPFPLAVSVFKKHGTQYRGER